MYMPLLLRLKNILIAKVINRFPALADKLVAAYKPWETVGAIPWTAPSKPLAQCKLALVTTSGIHHQGQQPFDMDDRDGDPSFRELNSATLLDSFTITHDYYDHSDAEKDPGIIFPLRRLQEFQQEGVIGELADKHYAFMGHIDGRHIPTLIEKTAQMIAQKLHAAQVDVVLLTPA